VNVICVQGIKEFTSFDMMYAKMPTDYWNGHKLRVPYGSVDNLWGAPNNFFFFKTFSKK
jgi:hypothetical protein